MKRVLRPQGFEECRKPLTTICGLQPLQEGPTDRVIQGLAVTAWYTYLPKSCSVPLLPPCSNARDGLTAEGSTAMRQRSQDGAKRQTGVFLVPSCCPYAQHPPQALLPQLHFMPGLFLPSGVSQMMETGLDEGSLWTSARTQHPLLPVPCDGETIMKPSALQELGLPEGLWLFSKRTYKTIKVSATRMGQLRNDRTCAS